VATLWQDNLDLIRVCSKTEHLRPNCLRAVTILQTFSRANLKVLLLSKLMTTMANLTFLKATRSCRWPSALQPNEPFQSWWRWHWYWLQFRRATAKKNIIEFFQNSSFITGCKYLRTIRLSKKTCKLKENSAYQRFHGGWIKEFQPW